LVAIVAVASFGAYAYFGGYFQPKPPPIVVSSNRLVEVAHFGVSNGNALASLGAGYYWGIWQMRVSNDEPVPLRMFVTANEGQEEIASNDTTISPGASVNVSACTTFKSPSDTFTAEIFGVSGTNGTSALTPRFPVAFVNATRLPFDDQFIVTSTSRLTYVSLPNGTAGVGTGGNVTLVETSVQVNVTDAGTQEIPYLFAFLLKGSSIESGSAIRCAGSSPRTGFPAEAPYGRQYGYPVNPGETAGWAFTFAQLESQFDSGGSYTLVVAAVFANNSEVVHSVVVPAVS
jgi:hypothetical protein